MRYKQWHELWQVVRRQLDVMELMQKRLEMSPPASLPTQPPEMVNSQGGETGGA